MKREISVDRGLRLCVKNIEETLYNSQQQTLYLHETPL